ncbi:Hypothetical predicted protein [Mytilus galloprovincialis]|uniref:Tyrosinase copper-binding domain-containing protein n=1 Tax=Mytilus galloprovincialis TaxID=29158 RepID=A0A8B6D6B6_MYTGA|nr:Hypothetical predicted protein [Mytilus galloprovincialis]
MRGIDSEIFTRVSNPTFNNMRFDMEVVFYLIAFVSPVFSMMTEKHMPEILCKCLNEKAGSITIIPPDLILYKCVNKYLAETWLERYHPPRLTDPDTINWIRSLGRKVRGQEDNIRTKRQAVRRVRREIRTLTDAQRNRFIQAVLQLKTRRIGTTNRYDALASAHDGTAIASAHFGPNFPSWHREYLKLVHVWVGGTMLGINTAPSDPVFYLHHCFIDYVWEVFRQRQTVDPEKDYPFDQNASPSHAPNRIMDNLQSGKKNIDGYSNDYTDQYYRYERSPTTCRQCRNQYPYLRCGDRFKGLCSATNRASIPRFRSTRKNKDLGIKKKFSTTINDSTRNKTPRRRRSTGDWLVYEHFLEEETVSKTGRTKRSISSRTSRKENRTSHITGMDSSMQNSFLLDGEPDIKRWVFIPVKIVHKRPSGLLFGTKVIKNKNIVDGVDVYSYNNYMNYTDEEQQKAYSHSFTSGSGADKVYVQVDGMSYNGKYVDYTIVDSRLPVSESIAIVAVKNPKLNSSISYISAYDSHGRICRPYCHSYGSYSNQFKTCSGVINLTEENPKLYGEDVGEVTRLLYESENGKVFSRSDENIFLSFYCDFHEIPWGKC